MDDGTSVSAPGGRTRRHREANSPLTSLTFTHQLGDFARRTLTAAALDNTFLDTLTLATDFTQWDWHTGQLPLDTSLLYDLPVLEYYLQTACRHMTGHQLDRRRRTLLHIRTRLTATAVTAVTAPTPPQRPPITPYTATDVLSILSWARTQTTPQRRASAHALIALGLGAGLTAHEIITTRARDIRRSTEGGDIAVGPPHPRVVPVLHQLIDTLPPPTALHPDDFVFRPRRAVEHRNSISDFGQRGPEARLHPLTSRMRATWLVHQLQRAAPLNVIATAAGLQQAAKLMSYARFLPDADTARPDTQHTDGRSALR